MSRSQFKIKYSDLKLLKKSTNLDLKIIRIYKRNNIILPSFIGKEVLIHNGNRFRKLLIKDVMVGHKFGEFSWTRKMNHYDRLKRFKKKNFKK